MKRRSKIEIYTANIKACLKATSIWPEDKELLNRLYTALDNVLIANVR